jgi:hypothetical protein
MPCAVRKPTGGSLMVACEIEYQSPKHFPNIGISGIGRFMCQRSLRSRRLCGEESVNPSGLSYSSRCGWMVKIADWIDAVLRCSS